MFPCLFLPCFPWLVRCIYIGKIQYIYCLIYSIGPHRFIRIPHPSCLTFSVDWHIIRVISYRMTSSGLNPLVFQLIDRQFLISYGETSSRLSVFQILSHKVRGMLPGRQIIRPTPGSGKAHAVVLPGGCLLCSSYAVNTLPAMFPQRWAQLPR